MTSNTSNPFINDKNADLSRNDFLNTSAYVDALYGIIQSTTDEKNTTPLTIGLTGKWGAGKSTIIDALKKKINHDNSRNIMLVYDAWKFDANAFKRDFLCYLDKELNNSSNNVQKSLYKNKDSMERIKAEDTEWTTKHKVLFIIMILLAIIVSILATSNFIDLTPVIIISFTVLFTIISQTIASAFVSKSIFISYQTIQDEKFFSSEQFFGLFNTIIETTKKNNHIIIALDNIDRLQSNQHEILSTIKIFLENDNCSFLIPFDRDQLLSCENNREEFIRKYFSITLNMRKYNEEDLYDFSFKTLSYANDLIPQNNINDISQLLSDEFFNNPRQIICFINNFIAEIFLARSLENNNQLPKGAISSNPLYLSKYLLFVDRFSHLSVIKNDPSSFIRQAEENIKNEDPLFENLLGTNELTSFDFDALTGFFVRNQAIVLNNKSNLKYFNILTDRLIAYPDNLLNYVLSYDWGEIKKLLDKNFSEKDFIEFITNQIRLRKIRLVSINPFLYALIFALCDENFSTKAEIAKLLQQHITKILDDDIDINNIPLEKRFVASIVMNDFNYSIWLDQVKKALNSNNMHFLLSNTDSIKYFFSKLKREQVLEHFRPFFSTLLKLGPKHFNRYIKYIQGVDLSLFFNDEVIKIGVSYLDFTVPPNAQENELALFIISNTKNINIDHNIIIDLTNELECRHYDFSLLSYDDDIDQEIFNTLKCIMELIKKTSIKSMIINNSRIINILMSFYKKCENQTSSFKGLYKISKNLLIDLNIIDEHGLSLN